jgi:hypothetical protein
VKSTTMLAAPLELRPVEVEPVYTAGSPRMLSGVTRSGEYLPGQSWVCLDDCGRPMLKGYFGRDGSLVITETVLPEIGVGSRLSRGGLANPRYIDEHEVSPRVPGAVVEVQYGEKKATDPEHT